MKKTFLSLLLVFSSIGAGTTARRSFAKNLNGYDKKVFNTMQRLIYKSEDYGKTNALTAWLNSLYLIDNADSRVAIYNGIGCYLITQDKHNAAEEILMSVISRPKVSEKTIVHAHSHLAVLYEEKDEGQKYIEHKTMAIEFSDDAQ